MACFPDRPPVQQQNENGPAFWRGLAQQSDHTSFLLGTIAHGAADAGAEVETW